MNDKRQNSQKPLASQTAAKGEPPMTVQGGSESSMAEPRNESLALTERLMEEICNHDNLRRSLNQVKANRGSPGIDGMKVSELEHYLRAQWPAIEKQLLAGTYKPKPVKRVEIPKPEGGVRKLGIPTVIDRLIQQMVMQVLQGRWDGTFSEHSYGFRPGRSAHQAVAKAQEYIAQGYRWVVDMDLEKFFDRVNHDRLMARVAERVKDKRLLKLIRAFLNAGVMEGGLSQPTEEGVPQGGPLSPLLSNLVLDELDKELERRGHCFVRYADDCNIYVRSERAGRRVMESVTRYIAKKLKLKVNSEKSAVAKPHTRKFLGFSFTSGKQPKRRIASKALERFKKRVRWMTRPTVGTSYAYLIGKLSEYLKGWRAYFGYCETPSKLERLDSWVRRRLRCLAWRRWKHWRKRFKELRKRGVEEGVAMRTACSGLGPWRLSNSLALNTALPVSFFDSWNLTSLARSKRPTSRTAVVRTRTPGGVGGGEP